jgi:hypothetical protein
MKGDVFFMKEFKIFKIKGDISENVLYIKKV